MTTILIVDDISENRYLLAALFKGNGYETMSAADGAEALALARKSPPDLIITDILMPVMDGFELCRIWKKEEELKHIPFVVYTATFTDPKDERLALSMGADRFLIKPQKVDALLGVAREVLEKAVADPDTVKSPSPGDEMDLLRQHNDALLRKLEKKVMQLETEIVRRDRVESLLRAKELSSQALLNLHLMEFTSESDLFRTALDEIVALTESELGFLGQIDESMTKMSAQMWSARAMQDCAVDDQPVEFSITGGGLWAEALRRREVVMVNDYHEPHPAKKGCPKGHVEIRRFLGVPVMHNGRPVLAVGVANKQRNYDDADVQMATLFLQGAWNIASKLRSKAESARLTEQLRHAMKMDSVGRLAGAVAHDFNNLLSVVLGYADFALDALHEGDPLRNDIEEIRKAGERAAALTRQLLAFSRKQIIKPEVVCLNTVVSGLESMLRRLLGEHIEINVRLTDDLGSVLADPGQIEQIIMNMAVNARDAMPDGGALTIETANIHLDGAYTERHFAVTPGRYILLSITDSGCGMDADTKEQIFEPFFTTKGKGNGTGLGLSIVYGIVKQSGGNILVYSEPGHGTTFKVYLPRVDAAATDTTRPQGSGLVVGSETVLIAEDEEAVRGIAERILRGAGYQVMTASNGGEALLICEKMGGAIDLLLTDVVMPHMSGVELSNRLTAICPRLKTLYMSGYTDNGIVHNSVLDPGARFIGKPFAGVELTRKVRETLDS